MTIFFIYAATMTAIVLLRDLGRRKSIQDFLVAGRSLDGFIGSASIAASWIWAPAIFISTKIGFQYGFSALVWFCLPNMLALLIFAPLAATVCRKIPDGFSYIDFAKSLGGGFWRLQLVLQLAMQIIIFAIQLSAGAKMLMILNGTNFYFLVISMALTPLAYSLISGLRASIFTDAIQYLVILLGVAAILSFFPYSQLTSKTSEFQFDPFDKKVLIEFGISSALGLIVAIFADQQQWQRAFAAKQKTLIRTFCIGGLFHLVVTTGLGTFGFLIAKSGFSPLQQEMVGVEFVREFYNPIFILVYVIMALCALISTLDSALCAFSSLYCTQVRKLTADITANRLAMVVLALLGAALACSKLSLIALWFMAGTIRLSSFASTLGSICLPNFSGARGTLAIILGLTFGIPPFAYGMFTGDASFRTCGMALAVAVSSISVLWPSPKRKFNTVIAVSD